MAFGRHAGFVIAVRLARGASDGRLSAMRPALVVECAFFGHGVWGAWFCGCGQVGVGVIVWGLWGERWPFFGDDAGVDGSVVAGRPGTA